MRIDLLGLGVLLAVVGAALFFAESGQVANCNSAAGQLLQEIDNGYQQTCSLAIAAMDGGGVIAVIGVLMVLLGAVMSEPVTDSVGRSSARRWVCQECNRVNVAVGNSRTQYCPQCGTKHMVTW